MKQIFIILVLVALSSCKAVSPRNELNYEYISTNYSTAITDKPEQVQFYFSEKNVPAYQEIGLIRIKTYVKELNSIILPAKKIAAQNGGNCMVYKQTAVSAQGEWASIYIYEFIVGIIK